jgi:Recombinase zinc beta ribbon domain/Recombinase
VHLAPKPPTGYRRLESGRLRPDPAGGPVMSELFARRADGESITRLCRFIEQRGVMTPYGNSAWGCTSLRGVLRNRVYLDEVRCAEHVREGAHPPLTDPVTWQRAQSPREMPRRHASRPSLLAGLVRCAGCGMSMSAGCTRAAADGRVMRHYVCARHFSAGECPAPASIAGTLLEPYVTDIAFELLRHRRRPPATKVAQAEAKAAMVQAALVAYRDNPRLQTVLDEDTFANGLAVRSGRVQRALLELASARARHATHALPSLDELEERWPVMDISARHEIIGQVIDCAIVSKGQRHVADRVSVFPAGCGPTACHAAATNTSRCAASRPSATTRPPCTRRAGHGRGPAAGSRASCKPSSAPAHTGRRRCSKPPGQTVNKQVDWDAGTRDERMRHRWWRLLGPQRLEPHRCAACPDAIAETVHEPVLAEPVERLADARDVGELGLEFLDARRG